MKHLNIAQIGTFDVENMGDLMFPFVLEKTIAGENKDISVYLFSPVGGAMPFCESREVFPLSALAEKHAELHFDAIIIGGGDLIRFDRRFASSESYVTDRTAYIWAWPVLFGLIEKIPVYFNAPGVPFRFSGNQFPFVRALLKLTDSICVRDNASRQLLLESGSGEEISVAPDTVFLFRELFPAGELPYDGAMEKLLPGFAGRYCILQLNALEEHKDTDIYLQLIERIHNEYSCDVLLFPIGYVHSDTAVLSQLYDSALKTLKDPSYIHFSAARLTPFEQAAVISRACGFIGTSLHGNILSCCYDVPFIALNPPFLTKISGMLDILNMPERECRSISDVIPMLSLLDGIDPDGVTSALEKARSHMRRLLELIETGYKKDTALSADIISEIPVSDIRSFSSAIYWAESGREFDASRFSFLTPADRDGDTVRFAAVQLPEKANRLRLNPCEGADFSLVSSVRVLTDCGELKAAYVPGLQNGSSVFFDNPHPEILFESEQAFTRVEITANIRPLYLDSCGDAAFAAADTISALRREAAEKEAASLARQEAARASFEAEISAADSRISAANTEISSLKDEMTAREAAHKTELAEMEAKYRASLAEANEYAAVLREERNTFHSMADELLASTSWKLTAPLRAISKFFRQGFRSRPALPVKTEDTGAQTAPAHYRAPDRTRQTVSLPMLHGDGKAFKPFKETVSVVIPTLNAGAEFTQLMRMLTGQKGFDRIDIIIVDSGSTDDTVSIATGFNADVTLIKPEEFSHSYARNLGIERVRTDYVLVMTQDAMPTSLYWIYNMCTALHQDKKTAAVSCGEFPRADADLYHRIVTWNHYRFIGSYENDAIKAAPESNDAQSRHAAGQLSDIACFMRTETARKYPYRGDFAEDLDLGLRLLDDGYKLGFLGHELAIHSHNRPAYYYLKRRYVEFLTLKKIFPDQDVLPYTFEKVAKEAVFVLNELNGYMGRLNSDLNFWPTGMADFADRFMDAYHAMYQAKFKPSVQFKEVPWLDEKTNAVMKELTGVYNSMETAEDEVWSGYLLSAIEGYLVMMFNYMNQCYELVNEDIFTLVEECLGKIFAGALGTFFAYSRLCESEGSGEHEAFYKSIGGGV